MNILLFNGSPRKKGNTALLFQKIIEGIEQTPAEYEHVHLAELKIHPCIGCGSCEKQGICIFNDDMQLVYKKISTADRIIIGSPIYFYAVTAQTKAFVDRCQALWSKKYLLHQPIGTNREKQRKGYLVSVAATQGKRVFEGAHLTARYVFDAMDCVYTDELLIHGVDKAGALHSQKDYLKQAVAFGRQVASL